MKPAQDVTGWVMSCFQSLRRSQQKTLAAILPAALRVHHITLASLGRAMAGPAAAKHRIKRADRFLGNGRIEPADAMAGVARRLLARRTKPVVVLLDWVDIRQFMVRVAALSFRGRALPLAWACYEKWEFFRSQNALEEGLLTVLRTILPLPRPVIVVADRGFGRVSLARHMENLKFHYVLRVKGKVWIDHADYWGRLDRFPLRPGQSHALREVRYSKEHGFPTNLVAAWGTGAKEPWFLITDLERPAAAVTALYGLRMRIEELFRDYKNIRNGWALRQTQVRSPQRLSRLLLVLAAAYVLLIACGLRMVARFDARDWSSANRPGRCSLWTLGRLLAADKVPSLRDLLATLAAALRIEAIPNWG